MWNRMKKRLEKYYLSNLTKSDFVVRESLYIPKDCGLAEAPLRASLTFQYADKYKTIYLSHFIATDTHFILPRYFPIPKEIIRKLQDRRPEPRRLSRRIENRIELRENQLAAYEAMQSSKHGVVIMPCGSGKTVVALKLISERQTPSLIIVNTSHLFAQWSDRIKQFLVMPEEWIGVIRSGVWDWKKPIVIAMLQTLSKYRWEMSDELRSYFGLVIWDEVDEMSTPVYSRTADMFFGQRFGLSATKERADGMHRIYEYHIGLPIYQDYTQPLIPQIIFLELPAKLDLNYSENYANLITALSEDEVREGYIKQILEYLLRQGRKILVLGERKEQLRRLNRQFDGSGLCIQEVEQEERIRQLQTRQIIFAIRRLAKRGLDQPDLDTLVMLTPLADKSNVQQAIGRVLRDTPNKKSPLVIILDDISAPPVHYVALKMRKVVKQLGYKFERRKYHEFFTGTM